MRTTTTPIPLLAWLLCLALACDQAPAADSASPASTPTKAEPTPPASPAKAEASPPVAEGAGATPAGTTPVETTPVEG
ncbi:MAG: hypothetical protein KDK70_19530, partial [Myxococcales bacterium]|nr:hypothetical protein [Myxococcales bacterium]